jgi:hypothetical protein
VRVVQLVDQAFNHKVVELDARNYEAFEWWGGRVLTAANATGVTFWRHARPDVRMPGRPGRPERRPQVTGHDRHQLTGRALCSAGPRAADIHEATGCRGARALALCLTLAIAEVE